MRFLRRKYVDTGPKVTVDEAKEIMRRDDEEPPAGRAWITVDRKRYLVQGEPYSGLAIKQLASVPQDYRLHLECNDTEDLEVLDDDLIQLKNGQEFYSEPPYITAG